MADLMIQVAAGVVRNPDGQILITQRPQHVHQGGLWEFPGGKLETGESVQQALYRELREEVGISVLQASRLIRVAHDYGDKQVLLDVWQVTAFADQAYACEGQALMWVDPEQLTDFDFPAANWPIIKAAQLPAYYPILEGVNQQQVLARLQKLLTQDLSLIQLRLKLLPNEVRLQTAKQVLQICQQRQIRCLLNSDLNWGDLQADGWHLSSRSLMTLKHKPANGLVAASCHNLAELQQAQALNLDFAVLAPIQKTTTHPDVEPMGWTGLLERLDQLKLPVYLMGGLQLADLEAARQVGAQGLAGISTFL